ncbi:hypothetical protein V9T40_008346 [Parthenolecanium corni]|uniref:C2H2-type domain-containing protein n=1 Tax=Parthenolecanium corni TaxID=536013 RepID=A0AAN9Y800_9HEMI
MSGSSVAPVDTLAVENQAELDKRKPMDVNRYATKKTVAQGMLDIALLTANASQLKYILQSGDKLQFYTLLLWLISASILLQVFMGLLFLSLNMLRDLRLHLVEYKKSANLLNHIELACAFIVTTLNIIIGGFDPGLGSLSYQQGVLDYDLLPKMICQNCATKLDEIDNFRQFCLEAEKMLQDFRTTLNNTVEDGEAKVYVKDSQSQIINSKPSLPNEPIVPSNSVHRIPSSECETESRTVTRVTVPSRVAEETQQMPLQCTVPLKLNGTTTSVVPLNVENISSLMQVVPDNEIPRIQQFKLPIQTELALVSEPSNTRFSVSLPTVDIVSKENAVIQSLQCAVNNDGIIDLHKVGLQSTAATSTISYNNSVAVSLVPSPVPNIVSNNNIEDVISHVDLIKEEQTIRSCTHCGKILTGPNDVCNHTVVRPAISSVSTGSETNSSATLSVATPKLPVDGVKPYSDLNGFSCDICEKPFRKREHLLQHRKLHTGDRPYICTSCGKSFSRKEHLFRHMLAHTGEKRHSCDFCGKTFSRKDNLHKHRKIHGFNGPYECELCGKSFIVQHYFLMHKANHGNVETEELPFQCDICKKGFVKEEFLNRHKVRHRVRNAPQLEETDLASLNPVSILSPNIVQQNICIEEAVYVSTQPTAYSVSPVVSNTTAATQTFFSTDLTSNGQLLGNYKQSNATIVT